MDIEIFYHIADIKVWKQHTEEQIDHLKKSGLWYDASRIHFQLHYDPKSFEHWVTQFEEDPRITYTIFEHETHPYSEVYSMVELQDIVSQKTEPTAIFRYHTKGLSHRPSVTWPLAKAWLDYYNYWNVDNWHFCYQALSHGYDTVGANWHTDKNLLGIQGHWSGNVWWANSEYIKTLKKIYPPQVVGFRKQLNGYTIRHDAELWIGTSSRSVRNLELHHYEHGCVYHVPPPSNYRLI